MQSRKNLQSHEAGVRSIANGNGISTPGELSQIAANDIGAISLSSRAPGGFRPSRAGNRFLGIGSYTSATGISAEAIAVGFSSDQSNTRFILPDGFEYDPEVFSLPNLRGYGSLPDLWVAMSLDPVLKAMVQDLMAGDYDDIGHLIASYTKEPACLLQVSAANDNGESKNVWRMVG